MVTQYNHFLFKQSLGDDSVQDADGGWVTNPPQWVLHSVCREETNGKGSTIQTVDGKTIVFSSLIQLPKGAERIAENTPILVSETNDPEGVIRIQGPTLKFDNGQLHCRLWV